MGDDLTFFPYGKEAEVDIMILKETSSASINS